MGTENTDVDDRIASALLGDSTYERLRIERHCYFRQPTPTKIAWLGGLLFAVALVAPIAATYPPSTQGLFVGGVLQSSPKIVTLGVFAVVIEVGCAGALTAVLLRRRQLEPDLTVEQAATLLTVEDLATLLGVVTGGATVLLTDAFFLLGHGGVAARTAFVEAGGGDPFAAAGHDVTVLALAVAALLAGCGFTLLSRSLEQRA